MGQEASKQGERLSAMTLLGAIRVAGLVVLSAGVAQAQKSALQATLDALDASSAKFQSAQATFHKDTYTAAVKDHDLQVGMTYAKRAKGDSEVGIKITGAGARTVLYKKGEAKDYSPGLNCYNAYSVTKSKSTIESLLALSFGASGKELVSNWTVTDLGPDTVESDGRTVKVEKLDLVPKVDGLKNNIKHIQLWTDVSRAVSLKQVVYTSSTGDSQTATYADIQINKPVNAGPFEIKGKACSK
jgi:outer membrane lipoprotein-sorting protein